MKLQGAIAPRPLTHDLLVNILGALDVEVVRVTVTELRENTFHASITVTQNGAEVEIDSRSSDAIAVAVRAQVPIFAADDVIEESAIEMEGDEINEDEVVDEFRRFLDHVSAEDFIEAEVEGDLPGAEEDVEAEAEDDD
jgi:bifunctional DNase/RNase